MFWQIAETLLTAERKTAGFSIPSVFVFIPPSLSLSLSLYFSHSPPTVVFAPIVTTQQPALPSSDWWISCDGGGLSERDLSALKQLSLPIHISSTAKERAGAASALAATAAKAKSLLFCGCRVCDQLQEPQDKEPPKDFNIHKSPCFLFFPPSCSLFATSRSSSTTEETDFHHKTASRSIVGLIWRRKKKTLHHDQSSANLQCSCQRAIVPAR